MKSLFVIVNILFLFTSINNASTTLLVRLPLAYYMSIQTDASLTKIGFAAPAATIFGILLNVVYLIFLKYKKRI